MSLNTSNTRCRNVMFAFVSGLLTVADDSTLKWYKELQSLASHCAQSFEDLNNATDMQVKNSTEIVTALASSNFSTFN